MARDVVGTDLGDEKPRTPVRDAELGAVLFVGLKLGQRVIPILGRGDRVKRGDQRPRMKLVGLGLLLKLGAAEGTRPLGGHGLLATDLRPPWKMESVNGGILLDARVLYLRVALRRGSLLNGIALAVSKL